VDEGYNTFSEKFPEYLEKIDAMKHKTWKGQHPLRFTDTESIKSIGNRYKPA
jgi:hypothetical protein